MAVTPSPKSNGQHKDQLVSPEEGVRMIRKALLATLDETGDCAAEKTWQQHARLMLKHTERFAETLGMVQVLMMRQLCAQMVLKIGLAGKRTGQDSTHAVVSEYEQMLEEIFTQVPQGDILDDAGEELAEE